MGLPKAREAQPFFRSAKQRVEDADYLLEAGRTTGAIYLAGYGVECILKALILNGVAKTKRAEIIATFRGAKAHDFDLLEKQYRNNGGASFPPKIRENFVLVGTWSTDFRYRPGTKEAKDAKEFLEAVAAIIEWADGRM